MSPSLEVSLNLDKVPSLGDSITVCVKLRNQSGSPRILREHVDAQLKEYHCNPQQSFWRAHKEVHVQPGQGRAGHAIAATLSKQRWTFEECLNRRAELIYLAE